MSEVTGSTQTVPAPIYALTEFQFGNLHHAANGNSVVFAVLEPASSDTPEKQTVMKDELLQIRDLIDLKLLKDVSDKFKEGIEASRLNNNRGFIVVALTDASVLMFKGSKKRVIN
jgi:hypothetical protein